jgi:hypothetical protein
MVIFKLQYGDGVTNQSRLSKKQAGFYHVDTNERASNKSEHAPWIFLCQITTLLLQDSSKSLYTVVYHQDQQKLITLPWILQK